MGLVLLFKTPFTKPLQLALSDEQSDKCPPEWSSVPPLPGSCVQSPPRMKSLKGRSLAAQHSARPPQLPLCTPDRGDVARCSPEAATNIAAIIIIVIVIIEFHALEWSASASSEPGKTASADVSVCNVL